MRLLETIRQNLQIFVAIVIALGLMNVYFLGGWHTPRSVLILVVVGLVIFPVMINMHFGEVFAHLKEPRPIFCSLFINFVVSPLIAFALGKFLLSGFPDLFVALLLIALIPTSAMSTVWVSFAGARVATAIYLVPANLFFAAFVGLPLIFPLLSGDAIQINQLGILRNLVIVFFIPLFAGSVTRKGLVKIWGIKIFNEKIQPNLGSISAVGLLILLLLAMSLPRNAILFERLQLLWRITLSLILYYGLL